jgi:hypothetical protein
MFSAGLFTPAADGGQRHVSTPHAGRLQDLPLSQMAPRLPPNPDAKEETTCRTRQQRDGWEDKAKDVSELVPVTPLTAQSRTGVPPFPFPIPKPCRNPVPVRLGHGLPPALSLPLPLPHEQTVHKGPSPHLHRSTAGAVPLRLRPSKPPSHRCAAVETSRPARTPPDRRQLTQVANDTIHSIK